MVWIHYNNSSTWFHPEKTIGIASHTPSFEVGEFSRDQLYPNKSSNTSSNSYGSTLKHIQTTCFSHDILQSGLPNETFIDLRSQLFIFYAWHSRENCRSHLDFALRAAKSVGIQTSPACGCQEDPTGSTSTFGDKYVAQVLKWKTRVFRNMHEYNLRIVIQIFESTSLSSSLFKVYVFSFAGRVIFCLKAAVCQECSKNIFITRGWWKVIDGCHLSP